MPGIWMTRIARRLTRPDTFDRLVSPAIADLQLESQLTRFARWRHYPAIVLVIAWALISDLAGELPRVFDAEALRLVWRRAAAYALAGAAVNWAIYYTLIGARLSDLQIADTARQTILQSVVYQSVAPGLTVLMIVAAYNLKRRDPAGLRTVAAATIVVAVTTLVATYVSTLLQEPALHAFALERLRSGATYEVVRPPLLINAISMVPFAWLGVVLSRRRGWPLGFSACTILGTWVLLNVTGFSFLYPLARLVPGLDAALFSRYSVPSNLLTLVGLILLWRTIERRFDRRDVVPAR